MQKYDKWYVTKNDKVIWCGSKSKLLEKYKLTNEQFYELLKNQQFPWGEITKKIDYYDFSIPKDFSFHNWNGTTYIKCLCRRVLIGMLENNEYIDASVDSVMDNEFETPNLVLIENMAKLAFGLEKIKIKIHEHPDSSYCKIVSIRLPMKQFPSCCFTVGKYILNHEHSNGYRLIKEIFSQIQELRNMPPCYIGRIIYKGTGKTGPANEQFDIDNYKRPRYVPLNMEEKSTYLDVLNIL